MKRSVAFVLSACAGICGILTIVSLATPVWISSLNGEATSGLFEYCDTIDCYKYPESKLAAYVKATQAFLIIALVILGCNTVYCILVASKKAPAQGIAALFAAAAATTLVAMGVFTGKTHSDISDVVKYGYSFILGWIVFGLNAVLVPVAAVLAKVSEYSVIP